MHLRNFTIEYSKKKAKELCKHEDDLNERYNTLFKELNENIEDENVSLALEYTKSELEKINAAKTEGIRIRSRVQFIEENEKSTKYFLSAEKRNYKIKHITKLKNEVGSEITNPKDILKLEQEFYEKLYGNNTRDESYDELFLENLPILSEESSEIMEAPLTIKEFTEAMKCLKGGKAPGTDGFTASFYKFFWIDIKEIICNSLFYAFKNNLLSHEQRRAILRLFCKYVAC